MKRRLILACCFVVVSGVCSAEATKWTFPLDAPASAPTLYPNETAPTGVVVAAGSNVILLDGAGKEVWRAAQPARIASPATVADIDADGAPETLVALVDGCVVCLDASGKTRWTHAFNTPAGGFKNLVAADLTPSRGLEILAGFDDGWLNCLSADGQLLWRFFGDKFRVGGIAVACVDGGGVPAIVYGTDNGHVYCLDSFGRVQWRYSELAPYGRSGPNFADLRGDGKPEVLITRSNVGNATCLMALDAVSGKFLWRTQDVMQGYFSNVTVDLDGDGKLEVLHGDKANYIYCENADGTRRWKTELGGRGLFWAPAVADVDGDGQLEILAGVRATDPKTKACVFVAGSNGAIKAALAVGNGANASPAVGDIDGDKELEVVVVTEDPSKVQALTWHAAGRVAWPSMRGNSRMTANGNLPQGGISGPGGASAPHALADLTPIGEMTVEPGDTCLGDNTWTATWNDPAGENAFLEIAAICPDGVDETRVVDLKRGATRAELPLHFERTSAATVVIHLHTNDVKEPLLAAIREVEPHAAEFCRFDEVAAACESAMASGEAAHADASLLRARLISLQTEQDAMKELARSAAAPVIAEKATQLRAHARTCESLAKLLQGFWTGGGTGSFVAWQDLNPWDPFDPEAVPAALEMEKPVSVSAYGNEFEDAALTLLNITTAPLDVRCTFSDPHAPKQNTPAEPELAKRITLRRSISIPAQLSGAVFDALPELDLSRSIALPPGEARQLWLVIDTYGLAAGTHEVTLQAGSLSNPSTVRAIPIRIEVWPVELPADVYAKMNWCNVNPGEWSEQAVKDMVDHGISVVYGPPLPNVAVDAQGSRAGDVDWSEFDKALQRVPKYFTLMWGGPPPCKWPSGAAPGEDSAESFNGFKTGIQEMAAHLESKGFGYRQWAFYPIDEPWNTGFTEVPHLKKFCEKVKRADPKAQMYADPAGLVRVEYLEEFKGLIDVWQPEMNLLKRDPKLLEWFHANAKRLWAYEAPGPAKDLLPLGHYRGFAWLAWRFGLEGAGYWVYHGEDNWRSQADTDYSAVYRSGNQVVPSRRWEADRDGVEDYRALYVLRQEIEKARAAGRAAEADQAQALIQEAVEKIVGWQIGSIDEITRMTRDYEIDFNMLLEYRTKIAHEILRLRGK